MTARALSGRRFPRRALPYLLIAPTLLYYAAFWVGPVFHAALTSVLDSQNRLTLDHYRAIFTDAYFSEAVFNTLFIVLVSVTLEFVLAFGLALLINMRFRGAGAFLFIAMIPMALPPVAVGAMWTSGFVAEGGWANSLLQHLGLLGLGEQIVFLGGGAWASMALVIVVDAWQVIPFMMILLLAGLQNIDRELQEAATVFGAGRWTVFRRITLPLLKPTVQTALLLRIISALQIWLIIVMLFGFKRIPVLLSEVLYAQEKLGLMRVAMAYSVLVALIVSGVAILYLKVSGALRREPGS
jgi:multiple sugar transport system permease protein